MVEPLHVVVGPTVRDVLNKSPPRTGHSPDVLWYNAAAESSESVPMEKDEDGRYIIELNKTAAVLVEQIEDEITVMIASTVNIHFEVTTEQALQLSRALAAAAADAVAEGTSADQ